MFWKHIHCITFFCFKWLMNFNFKIELEFKILKIELFWSFEFLKMILIVPHCFFFFQNRRVCIMKIKRLFMKVNLLLNQVVKCPLFKPKFKLEHVMIQFRFHNIHTSDQAQLAIINMSLKWHHIHTCKNKL
jgi:hypothetical protein